MEIVFLACFIFGALFTVTSVVLGFAGHELHELHLGHGAHAGHVGHSGPGVGASGHGDLTAPGGHAPHQVGPGLPAGDGAAHAGHHAGPAQGDADQGAGIHHGLPLLNASSILAFLTWFGAAGYLLTAFGGWPLWGAVPAAMVAGLAGASIIALFLAKVMAGESEMSPRDYRLEGTIARVSSGIPAGGVGEIVFTKAGACRGEAARNLSGRPLPRDTEVVILEYERGVATVQPWDELAARPAIDSAQTGEIPPAGELGRESGA